MSNYNAIYYDNYRIPDYIRTLGSKLCIAVDEQKFEKAMGLREEYRTMLKEWYTRVKKLERILK